MSKCEGHAWTNDPDFPSPGNWRRCTACGALQCAKPGRGFPVELPTPVDEWRDAPASPATGTKPNRLNVTFNFDEEAMRRIIALYGTPGIAARARLGMFGIYPWEPTPQRRDVENLPVTNDVPEAER